MTTDVGEVEADEPTFDERLGEAIHQELWRRRITQTQFAKQLGITQSALSQKTRGTRPFLAGELSLIAALLDVSVGDLMPAVTLRPDGGDDGGGGASAPSRTRTYDLRIKSP